MLISTDGGAQQHRIVGGSQQIAISAAEQLGDRILFSSPVRRIIDDGESVAIQADEVEVQAAHVIVAIPPTLTGRIDYQPALPGWRDQLTQRMPQGSVIKCMAVYDEPFWRADGLSGQVTSTDGPIKVVFDNTPPAGNPGVLLGFLEGEQARNLGRATAPRAARRRDRVLRPLLRAPRRHTRTTTSRSPGRKSRTPAAATAATSPPASGPPSDPASVNPADGSTGPAPKPPKSGTATWTARSAPANAQPQKSSPPASKCSAPPQQRPHDRQQRD